MHPLPVKVYRSVRIFNVSRRNRHMHAIIVITSYPDRWLTWLDSIQYLLQMDRARLVHPHHIAVFRDRIDWHCLCAQYPFDLSSAVHLGDLRSWHVAGM
jgi:hypothetical protein